MNAAEAVLPEELVKVVEGVGSRHFLQALHPAEPLPGGLQQPPCAPRARRWPRGFVGCRPRRLVRNLQRWAAGKLGQLVKAAGKKLLVEVSPLPFKWLLACRCQNSREERHGLISGRSTLFPQRLVMWLLSSLPALTCTSSTSPNSYCMSISLHRPLFNAPSPRAGKGGWVWDETWIERTYYFV